MRNISEYINEVRSSATVEIEYTPKDRTELIAAIVEVSTVQKRKKIIDFNCIDTKLVTDMTGVFPDAARSVKILYKRDFKVDQWDVSNVTTFKDMFRGMAGFTGYMLDKWPVGEKCVNVEGMFAGTGLTFSDISGWRLNNVSSINDMFSRCNSLEWVSFPYGMRSLREMQYTFMRDAALKDVTLPETTGEIKSLRFCFDHAGTAPFRIYNLDKIKCTENADIEFMFSYAVPKFDDIIGFVKENNLTYADCKKFKIEKSILLKLEVALNGRWA